MRNGTALYYGSRSSDASEFPGLIDSQEDVKPDGVESAWPELSSNERCKARLIDSDGDGMPDEWEIRHGLDPKIQTIEIKFLPMTIILCWRFI